MMLGVLIVQNCLMLKLWWCRLDVLKHGKFFVSSMYQDIGGSLPQTIVLFVCQLSLITLYAVALCDSFQAKKHQYAFWFVGVLVQISGIFSRHRDSLLGNTWNIAEWGALIRIVDQAVFVRDRRPDGHRLTAWNEGAPPVPVPFHVSKLSVLARGFMGWFVNNLMRDLLAFTLPLRLMQFDHPMPVVATCVGVTFVVKLDDMSKKTYDVTLRVDSESARNFLQL
jgi:hypothetical protein